MNRILILAIIDARTQELIDEINRCRREALRRQVRLLARGERRRQTAARPS